MGVCVCVCLRVCVTATTEGTRSVITDTVRATVRKKMGWLQIICLLTPVSVFIYVVSFHLTPPSSLSLCLSVSLSLSLSRAVQSLQRAPSLGFISLCVSPGKNATHTP